MRKTGLLRQAEFVTGVVGLRGQANSLRYRNGRPTIVDRPLR